MEGVITDFFLDRKTERLKKKQKANMSDEEIQAIHREVNDEFELANWLPNAARRAGQMSLSSHPCTFSHPSSRKNKNGKTTSVIAQATRKADGYLRTGNVEAEMDALGNAAALDVYKFLTLELSDGRTLIEHIEQDTEVSKTLLNIKNGSYDELKTGFLAMKNSEADQVTSSKVKQVFFPVQKDYHLLSILTPSGLMYELRNRIQAMRFSDQVKKAREQRRRNEVSDTGFDDVFGLSMVGYGGTKPQNISVLNNQYGGKAYLLPSLPSSLTKQEVKLPTVDFFTNCLWPNQFKDSFDSLHKLLSVDVNNIGIRQGRDNILLYVFDRIVEKIWQIRSLESGWSERERFGRLPKFQKILLDDEHQIEREDEKEWLDHFTKETARWLINAYKKVLGKKSLALNDDEMQHINKLITDQRETLL